MYGYSDAGKIFRKIGDHAENIGEWTIFMETGNMKDVRLL